MPLPVLVSFHLHHPFPVNARSSAQPESGLFVLGSKPSYTLRIAFRSRFLLNQINRTFWIALPRFTDRTLFLEQSHLSIDLPVDSPHTGARFPLN